MAEIEESSRLYREGDAVIMTAVVTHGAAEDRPQAAQVTFVLTKSVLVTVRYADPVPFRMFAAKCQRPQEVYKSAADVFVALLETIVDRAADLLESVADDLNAVASRLFLEDKPRRKATAMDAALQTLIRRLGRKNMTVSVLRESLQSIARLAPYARTIAGEILGESPGPRLKQIERDVRSLFDYEQRLSAEVGYLHEATLGLINLEQNRIIKVFSIAAVLFLPPTVVGTVYGMNFDYMPELNWLLGYPFALFLMLVSAAIPYLWFKLKGWL
jgi:magnesium transporter